MADSIKISIIDIINNYYLMLWFSLITACLVMISKALERDEEYPKGT